MRGLFSAVILSVLGLGLPAGPALACEKSLRWNDDPPFSMRSADGEVVGLEVEVNREVLRRMGCQIRLIEMPWARALAELESGRLDMLSGTTRTAERERFAYFSAPGRQTENVLFIANASTARSPGYAKFSKLADLRGSGFRLGAQIGVSYGAEYDALMRDPEFAQTVQRVPSRRSLWLMADAGRLDGVLADELTGRLELGQLGLQDRIRSSAVIVPHAPASVAFSKKAVAAEFVERYNRTREAMHKDGSLDVIWSKYGAVTKK